MKRRLVTAALLPIACASAAHAETTISTATTAPVATSTAASGQPDSITIDTAGSVQPTAAGAAVTLDATSKNVTNKGTIGFNNVDNAVGVRLVGGASGTLTSTGAISLVEDYSATDTDSDGDVDGAFAKGTGRFGIRATGTGPFVGDIVNQGSIVVEGADSAGISLETGLQGSLASSSAITVTGDRSVGLAATSVTGDVKITGGITVQGEGSTAVSLGDVGGRVVLQNTISATGYRSTSRVADDTARAKLDADDLKQGGGAVRITGDVAHGVLLDRPPADADANNADEDGDGVADANEATGALVSSGSAPALDIGSTTRATTIGVNGTGDSAYGLILKGSVVGNGVNDGVSATGLRIGQAGGGTTTVQGGIYSLGGTIASQAFGAQSTALLLNANADVPTLRNAGMISAAEAGGKHDARAIVDLSGRLGLIQNSGTIQATLTGDSITARAIAIDLSSNTGGAVVRQAKVATTDAPSISGEVLFGAGADRLELLGGTLIGAVSFGAGDDALVIDGSAVATTKLVDTDGRLSINVLSGRLGITNAGPVAISSLNVASGGVLALSIDSVAGAVTRLDVAGPAAIAGGAKVEVTLKSQVKTAQSFQVLKAQTLQVGAAGATLAGAPFLYQASLRSDATAGSLFIDVRPKTATELGLNRSESEAYAAVFEVLDRNDSVEAAVLKQSTQEGFAGLYRQMLPDHSGGALMSAQAAAAAVSSAAAQHMPIDKDSASSLWVQELNFQVDRDRVDAEGYRARGFGLAAGYDMLGEVNALGLGASFTTTDYHDRDAAVGEQISMNLVGGSAYWRLDAGALQAHARGGLGFAWFDGDRRITTTDVSLKTKANWTGWTAEANAGASYDLALGFLHARPAVSLDYIRLSEGGYTEKGGGAGVDLHVGSRKGDLLTGEATLTLGARFGDEVYVQPEVTVGWRQRLAGDAGRTTGHFEGGQDFTLDPEDAFKSGLVARVGIRGGSGKMLYVLDGGGTFDSDYKSFDLRASVRFQF